MYMKRLVADGFKSFYSRTEIEFDPGINAIVGPNGCGKSNIHDAIQWVLGEQSAKQLRGDEISDVIATGNVRRVSKDTAEAYLTFEDPDNLLDIESDEVEIGRRVNLDGEGTYFLNGETVRLKDLQDLFRDTGLGQSLYSSIGQGEVAGLVESRPEELREIIEEAAGIATYRHRRDLSRRRLEQTREELEDVENELREKQGRLSQLKGQAEKARKMREVKGRLRRCRLERAKRKLNRLQDDLTELETSREETESDLEDARRATRDTEDRWESLRDRVRTYEVHVNRLEDRLERAEDVSRESRETMGEHGTRAASLRERIGRAAEELDRFRADARDELAEAAAAHRRRYRQALERRITARERDYLDARTRHLKNRHRSMKETLEDLRGRRERILAIAPDAEPDAGSNERRDTSPDPLREKLRETRRELRECLAHRVDAVRRTRRLEGTIRRTRCRTALHREGGRVLRRRAGRIRRALRGDEDGGHPSPIPLEAFKRSSRRLARLDELQGLEGFVGVFDRMVTVPDAHRRAIRAALGPRYHAVLVRGEPHAASMARQLPSDEPTPIVIQPLVNGGGFEGPETVRREGLNGSLRPATSLLDVPRELEGLVDRWLGSVFVVPDLEAARRASEDLFGGSEGSRLVTLTGCRLESAGTLSTFPGDRGSTVPVWRGDTVEVPAGSVTVRRVRREGRRRRSRNRLDVLQDLREKSRIRARSQRDRLHELRSRLRRLRQELRRRLDARADRRREDLRTSLHGRIRGAVRRFAEERSDRSETREDRLQRRTDRLERRRQKRDDQLRDLERTLDALSSSLKESQRALDRGKNRLENLTERRKSARRQRREGRRHWHRTERNRVVEGLRHRRLRVEAATWKNLVRDLRTTRDELRESADDLNETLRDRERQLEQARSRHERTDRELANRRARLDDHREHIREELEVEPDLERLGNVDTGDFEGMDSDELDSEGRRLQSTLREMEPVNMLADKQAEELSEEVEETREQLEDLKASCEELEGIIGRLNRKAREQFLEAFEEIRDHFGRLVEELFRGGEGQLSLTDGPVLEAGVKLELKPPGENLKTLSALSGGEKTMTALAFLFALFERKPTPFCFMDEVDAALDDDNLQQFLHLLERYSEDTQFLLVTHQKTTMQAASRLFGVTMEESGVTSVIPTSFGEARELREGQPA